MGIGGDGRVLGVTRFRVRGELEVVCDPEKREKGRTPSYLVEC